MTRKNIIEINPGLTLEIHVTQETWDLGVGNVGVGTSAPATPPPMTSAPTHSTPVVSDERDEADYGSNPH